jgi:hypothetical protein
MRTPIMRRAAQSALPLWPSTASLPHSASLRWPSTAVPHSALACRSPGVHCATTTPTRPGEGRRQPGHRLPLLAEDTMRRSVWRFRCFSGVLHMDVVKEIRILHMLPWLYAYVANVCSKCFIYLSGVCCKCFYLDVANVSHRYCKRLFEIFHTF